MSKSFPEYTGKVKSGHANAAADIEDLMKEELEGNITEEIRDGIVPHVQDVSVLDTEKEKGKTRRDISRNRVHR